MSYKIDKEKGFIYTFIFLYVVINLVYSFSTNTVWDDDCPTRYYNTLNAFQNPEIFISIWNRPLFTLVFALPVQIGQWTIPVLMVIISVLGAYYLYKGLKINQIKNAYLIVPLMLFQTYFFSVSRNAETEPLAVALICFGYYFFAKKNWLAFVIVGSLLPLARLELSVLLVFWVLILYKEKQLKYIFILPLPLVLWNVAGGIITGDFNYVLNKTFKKDNSVNRYGHTSFGHYFQRYIYVVGPAVFFFLVFGLTNALLKFKFKLFVFWQFVAGFMLYVIFSWKLNMGNAAGFLRNLIPLTPLAAIIALEGFNFFGEVIGLWKQKNIKPQKVEKGSGFTELSNDEFLSLNRKKRQSYLKQKKEFEEKGEKLLLAQDKSQKTYRNNRYKNLLLFFVGGFVLVVLTYFFFSQENRSHHKLIENTFIWSNLVMITGVYVLIILFFIISRNKEKQNYYVFSCVLGLLALLFTVITEPPNSNESPERSTMEKVSDVYNNGYLKEAKTYVNHIWFFWANELNKFEDKYELVTMANLDSAKAGSICIWENHYSHRLAGDVQAVYFDQHPKWVELIRYISKDNKFQCAIYEKVDSVQRGDALEVINRFIQYQPEESMAYHNKAVLFMKDIKKADSAKFYFQKSIDLDSNNIKAFFNRGLLSFQTKDFNKAIADFTKCTKINDKWPEAWGNLGAAYTNIQKNDLADSCLTHAIGLKKDFPNALLNRARLYDGQKKYDQALKDYSSFLALQPNNEQVRLFRAQIYFTQNKWAETIGDLDAALKINAKNSNSWLVKGICHINLKQTDLACPEFQKAYELGNGNALNYLTTYCNNPIQNK